MAPASAATWSLASLIALRSPTITNAISTE